MRATRTVVLLIALALAGQARQAAGYRDYCCVVHSSPPWLAGWWFRFPSQEAADRALDRLGFAWAETPPLEGSRREVVIGCSTLSWLPETWTYGLGISTELGSPRIMKNTFCTEHRDPGPPSRRAESGQPNGAVELIRVIASASSLDSTCDVLGKQPTSWMLSRSLRFGRTFRVEGRRVREADLEYGGTVRVIEAGPGDPLSAGASGWLGFTVRVRDLETTARVLEDRGVRFSRVDAEDGPMLRVALVDGEGAMVEFVGER